MEDGRRVEPSSAVTGGGKMQKVFYIPKADVDKYNRLMQSSQVIIYREIKTDIGYILRELCNRKGIEIIEAEACPDHIHMLLSIPPKYSVSDVMGYLKGKSSLMIFDRHANLKYKFGRRTFWARGYYGPYLLGKLTNRCPAVGVRSPQPVGN